METRTKTSPLWDTVRVDFTVEEIETMKAGWSAEESQLGDLIRDILTDEIQFLKERNKLDANKNKNN